MVVFQFFSVSSGQDFRKMCGLSFRFGSLLSGSSSSIGNFLGPSSVRVGGFTQQIVWRGFSSSSPACGRVIHAERNKKCQDRLKPFSHFRELLKPAFEPEPEQITTRHYMRSFDRKDLGRKPKPLLDIPPTKFRVKEWPKEYTSEPLKTVRTGGRHPLTGRVIYRRIGGGFYRDHLWLDTKREYIPDTEKGIQEKVYVVQDHLNHTAKVALLGHGDKTRWVIATEHMKPGQLVKSSRAIGRIAIRAFEGDTHCVGALPVGTVISSVEVVEGQGATKAMNAGCCAQILKKEEGSVTIQLPSKLHVKVSEKCIATVGRVSNIDWINIDWGSAGATRARGIRPKSGLWHRKDGYCGRKLHPPKPLRDYLIPSKPKPPPYFMGNV